MGNMDNACWFLKKEGPISWKEILGKTWNNAQLYNTFAILDLESSKRSEPDSNDKHNGKEAKTQREEVIPNPKTRKPSGEKPNDQGVQYLC